MELGIVVLNYMNFNDAINCVDAFASQDYTNYHVVIVDNHSSNNSFAELKQHFENLNHVDVIETSCNLGYARGNNVGIQYLLKQGVDRVFVINPDTVLTNQHYFNYLATTIFPKEVGMVGTAIINLQMREQNPVPVSYKTPNSILDKIKDNYSFYRFQYLPTIPILTSLKKAIKVSSYGKKISNTRHISHQAGILDPFHEMLHGSAILFTENFLHQYLGFCPETFLFMEEDILALLCQKTTIRQYFTPELSITHKEDGSSDIVWSHERRDQIKYRYLRESAKIVRRIQRTSPNEVQKFFISETL